MRDNLKFLLASQLIFMIGIKLNSNSFDNISIIGLNIFFILFLSIIDHAKKQEKLKRGNK